MTTLSEHDFEPVPGLPQDLPPGEEILWQGTPEWASLARRAFHVRALSIYFAVLIGWRAVAMMSDGGSAAQAALAATLLLLLAGLAVGLMLLIAWFTAKTAMYTVTNKRIVMRIGIVLTVTFNIPFRAIENAGLKVYADGTGDIPLSLAAGSKIALFHLWPHARPWRAARPEPMLRSVPEVVRVGAIVARALADASGVSVRPMMVDASTDASPATGSTPALHAAAH